MVSELRSKVSTFFPLESDCLGYVQVDEINKLEPQMQKLSDEELRAKTGEFKSRVSKGEKLEDILVEAFAVSCSLLAQEHQY